MNLHAPGRLFAMLACAAVIFATASTGAYAGAPPPNLFTYAIPQGPQSIYSNTWIVGINEAGMQIPASSVVANLPDAPPFEVSLLNWYRNCCYLPSPGSPYDEVPDPEMPQDQFQWFWYGQGLSLSIYLGQPYGYVERNGGGAYQILPRGVGIALLGRVIPGGQPEIPPPRKVPTTSPLPLLALALSLVLLARRRLTTSIRKR